METANTSVIGIDLGGTHIRAGLVTDGQLTRMVSQRTPSRGSEQEVLQSLFTIADKLINESVTAIGIGVPGLADPDIGTVFDLVNIPAWTQAPLRQWMQDRYGLPVFIQNDANCFALGELLFGKARGRDSFTGLTIGTGLGTGIVINKKLYAGKNGGAGEFGMIPYLDHCYEYYASGQFFRNVYGTTGETVFQKAKEGDAAALSMYEEMGMHLGNAIQTILYAIDTDLVVLGGSVRHAFPYFSEAMWKQIRDFAYQRAVKNLTIEVSELENSGILGAAALYYNEMTG